MSNFISKEKALETIQIDILDPKVKKLLQNLADLKLISIRRKAKSKNFESILENFRSKNSKNISDDEIIQEIEQIRAKRIGK